MKSLVKYAGVVIAGVVATTGLAFAVPVLNVPEPGSLALVGLGVAGVLYFARKGKK